MWALIVGFVAFFFIGSWILWALWLGFLLYACLRPEANGRNAQQPNPQMQYVAALQAALAATDDESEKRGLRRALELGWQYGLPVADPGHYQAAQIATPLQPGHQLTAQDNSPVAAPPKPTESPLHRLRTHTDQTVAMLYLGAFLLVTAAALFLAYASVDNGARFAVLAVGALAFYVAGLSLLKLRSSLHPAAIVFVSIGILLLPICGVAAHSLLGIDSRLSWATTSAIGAVLYIYAAIKLRSNTLGYISVLSWVSVILSGASLAVAPLYFYSWLIILSSIILYLLRPRLRGSLTIAAGPVERMAQLLVPLTVLSGFVLTSQALPLWHTGVSLILAAFYYAIVARDSSQSIAKNWYAIAAQGTALLGGITLFHTAVSDAHLLGLLLLLLGGLHALWLRFQLRRPLFADSRLYGVALYTFASALSVLALLFIFDDRFLLSLGLIIAVGIHAVLSRLWRSMAYAPIVATALLFALPFSIAEAATSDALTRIAIISVGCFIVAAKLYYIRHLLRQEPVMVRILRVGVLVLLATAWMASLGSDIWWLTLSMQIATLLMLERMSRYEHWLALSVLTPSFVLAACLSLADGLQLHFTVQQVMLSAVLITSVYSLLYAERSVRPKTQYAMFAWTIGLGLVAWFIASVAIAPAFIAPLILLTYAVIALYKLTQYQVSLEWRTVAAAAGVIAAEQIILAYGAPLGLSAHLLLWALFAIGSAVWLEGYLQKSAQYYALAAAALVFTAAMIIGFVAVSGASIYVAEQPYTVLLLTAAVGAVAYFVRRMSLLPETLHAYRAVYGAAIAGTVVVALGQPSILLAIIVLLSAALVTLALSYKDQSPTLAAAVPLLFSLAAWQWLLLLLGAERSTALYFILALVIGAVFGYITIHLIRAEGERARALIVTTATLALFGWLIDFANPGLLPLAIGPLLLAATAGMLLLEGHRLRLSSLQMLVPIAFTLVALQQLMWRAMPETSWLIYTHIWAAYLALVVWRLRTRKMIQSAELTKYAALAVFSLPVVYQTVADPETYALILLAEHAALLVVGVFDRRAYLIYWSIIVSIVAVIYMARSYAFVQVGIIAATLIAYGIYRLVHAEKNLKQ